jgi:hypothetical protein
MIGSSPDVGKAIFGYGGPDAPDRMQALLTERPRP